MLCVENVSKQFASQSTPLLHNVNLQLKPGHSAAIMGASGSGKSSLLNMIAGLSECNGGRITLNDNDVTSMSEDERDTFRAQSIGMVFQQFNLIDCLSVKDNILLQTRYLGINASDLLLPLLTKLGIADIANDPIEQLSGGQQQRVAVARALLHRPSLILADEPTGNLDSQTSQNVAELLFSLARDSKTSLLVVTHSSDVAALADSIWLIKNGTLVPA